MTKDYVIVDCQYDFIDGSLACHHAVEAVQAIVAELNRMPEAKVFYSSDWHSPTNGSFAVNGGTWPPHCVAHTRGAALADAFKQDLSSPAQRPQESNLFFKGLDDEHEEYSAFEAKRADGKALHELLAKEVIVGGIATEFCVAETVKALLKAGFKVELGTDLLGYVSEEGHRKALPELEKLGAVIR